MTAASRARGAGRWAAAMATARMMTSGAAPMMTPTLAGSATRVAWIISTLHPARPMAASAASPATSRGARAPPGPQPRPFPAGRAGPGLVPQPGPGGQDHRGHQVTDGLAAQHRVAAEQAGPGTRPADQQHRPEGQPRARALLLVQGAHAPSIGTSRHKQK